MPSVDKLFGYTWVLCWFLSIWVYHVQLFLTGLFCLVLAYVIFNKSDKNIKQSLPALFVMDKNTRTLTVQKIYEKGLRWEDSEVCAGDANLPLGFISVGDVITNCNGNVALRHIPTNTIFGAFDFR